MPTRRFLLKLYSNICDPPQGPKDSVIMQRWFWIIGWIPTSLAVLGNALVIWFITTRRRLRKTANRFIVSLAVADFCIGSFLFPALFICERRRVFCTVHHERVISTSLSFLVHASAVTFARWQQIGTLQLHYLWSISLISLQNEAFVS